MKAIILAAGYGTRLLQDLQKDSNEKLKHLIGIPKPLLPVGQLPLISYWVKALKETDDILDIFVITNALYYSKFEEWAQNCSSVTVINDGTSSNEGRLGAVSCLQLVIDNFNVNDDVIVIGGDTLFFEDFHLREILSKFKTLYTDSQETNLVLSYPCKNEETKKYGILETDENLKVTALLEKPSAEDTTSRQACPCFYVFSKHTLHLVQVFLEGKKSSPLEEKDAPGNLLSWLVKRKPVYVHKISGRFDVGNLESYLICNKYFQEKLKNMPTYLQ
ncbi:UTP--glucose-1-phosphate uridylyltransferase-like [Bombina bombina]|uniref:UTP--glucose-1-phosphate uridylyltransferase-like n=1 Tax=Bombina bombina TaxID=8345 RepID=UPI00235A7D6E|nr:UTP--glucose-1-phosphate uridylyltransferase-like [Bombina bombina]XP_053554579.1 UTP--glucose-1-phosphate uridylyltransferase-like [Bombina bombina]